MTEVFRVEESFCPVGVFWKRESVCGLGDSLGEESSQSIQSLFQVGLLVKVQSSVIQTTRLLPKCAARGDQE